MVKNYIYSADIEENTKQFIFIYLYHNLKEKKKLRVYCDNYQDASCSFPVYVDIESNAIFSQQNGEYIGFLKNNEKIIIVFKKKSE